MFNRRFKFPFIELCWLLLIVANFALFGPTIETRLFPAYSKFEIETLEVVDATHTRATFRFSKLRECQSRGATWANGELGQIIKVVFEPSPDRLPRPLGEQLSRPYLFEATPEDIQHDLVAVITSRCPLMPWDTRSEIYP